MQAVSRNRRRKWSRWILLIVGVGAFLFMLHGTDAEATASLLSDSGPILILALLSYTLQIALDALSWKVLLRAVGERVRWIRLFTVRLSTEAILMSIPAGGIIGEGMKPYLLRKTDGIPPSRTVASVGMKKCLLVFAEACYLSVALALGWSVYVAHSQTVVGSTLLPWMAVGAVVFLLVVASFLWLGFTRGAVGDKLHRLFSKLPSRSFRQFLESHRQSFDDTDAGLRVIATARGHWLGAWAILLVAWFAEALETYVLLGLVGIDLPIHYVLAMESSAVFLRNLAFFMPAGLGIQDGAYLMFLSAYGINVSIAGAAFVILKRAKEVVWVAIGWVLFWRLDNGKKVEGRVSPPKFRTNSEVTV